MICLIHFLQMIKKGFSKSCNPYADLENLADYVLVRSVDPAKRWHLRPEIDPETSLPSYRWTKGR